MKGIMILALLLPAFFFSDRALAQTKPNEKDPVVAQEQHLRARSQVSVFIVEGVACEIGLNAKQREKLHRIVYFSVGRNAGDMDKMKEEATDAQKNDPLVFAAVGLFYQRLSEIAAGKMPKLTSPSSKPSMSDKRSTT